MSEPRGFGITELVRTQQNLLRSLQLAEKARSTDCPLKRQELAAKARLAFLASGVASADALARLLGVISGPCGRAADALGEGLTPECLNAVTQEALQRQSAKSPLPAPTHLEGPPGASGLSSSCIPCERPRSWVAIAATRLRTALGLGS